MVKETNCFVDGGGGKKSVFLQWFCHIQKNYLPLTQDLASLPSKQLIWVKEKGHKWCCASAFTLCFQLLLSAAYQKTNHNTSGQKLQTVLLPCSSTTLFFFFPCLSSSSLLWICSGLKVTFFVLFSRTEAVCSAWMGPEGGLPARLHLGGALLFYL